MLDAIGASDSSLPGSRPPRLGRDLGLYDAVLSYDEIDDLAPSGEVVLVDSLATARSCMRFTRDSPRTLRSS
jgi:hypothetical protein